MNADLKIRLLVVDDEQSIRRLCMTIGTSLGFVCAEAESAESAVSRLEAESPDLVLTDLKLPSQSGVELLRQVKALIPRTEVAIMTGHGSIESAVDAMKLGAYDYIEKPFRVEKMRLLLQRMAEKIRLVNENEFLRERVNTEENLDGIIGTSANIQDVLRMISRLKDTRTPVLISGESGTGKELAARAIHFRGAMAQTPFIAVDCGSLVPTLMESELFGYEKGAFTGASKSKAGLFQAANGGTIFLDEIGELPLEMQAKLLRVLQEKEVRPVGSNEKVNVDVRVIAATNRDLHREVKRGRFREDLYFRLAVMTVQVPPLRERIEDLPALVRSFLAALGVAPQDQRDLFSPSVLAELSGHDWPGNVRELRNYVERSVVLQEALPASKRLAPEPTSLEGDSPVPFKLAKDAVVDTFERSYLSALLDSTAGNISKAARKGGMDRMYLHRLIQKHGLRTPSRGDDE
jgi:two-component system, NtrC family, response regulator AtoC